MIFRKINTHFGAEINELEISKSEFDSFKSTGRHYIEIGEGEVSFYADKIHYYYVTKKYRLLRIEPTLNVLYTYNDKEMRAEITYRNIKCFELGRDIETIKKAMQLQNNPGLIC